VGEGKWSKRGLSKLKFGQNGRERQVTISWKNEKNISIKNKISSMNVLDFFL
jgi:hypothetical protein